jgi:hypothetical protein
MMFFSQLLLVVLLEAIPDSAECHPTASVLYTVQQPVLLKMAFRRNQISFEQDKDEKTSW